MRREQLRAGDLVKVDIRGRRFQARVVQLADSLGRVRIEPTIRGCGYRSCSARQVVRRVEPAGRRPRSRQLDLFADQAGA